MNMGKMIAKVRYYEWRDRLTPNENGELDHYAEEDAELAEKSQFAFMHGL